MIIDVTQEHINNGVPKSPMSCPIALAMREKMQLPKGTVSVHSARQIFAQKNSTRSWRVTYYDEEVVYDFIDRFDHERPVHPFSFELDAKA